MTGGGSVGDVKMTLSRVQELLREAGASSRSSISTNETLAARLKGAKDSAESTIKFLTNAHQRGEEALAIIRGLQAQTSHSEPPEIALSITQALEQVERGLMNTRNVLSKLDEMITLSTNTKAISPSVSFNIASAKIENYSARL